MHTDRGTMDGHRQDVNKSYTMDNGFSSSFPGTHIICVCVCVCICALQAAAAAAGAGVFPVLRCIYIIIRH